MRINDWKYCLMLWAEAPMDLLTFYPSAKADGNSSGYQLPLVLINGKGHEIVGL